jgi:Zn-dependent oligopeptidases
VIGGFYFDLYARQGKRGGAWMSGFRSRMQIAEGLQKPNLLYGSKLYSTCG